MRSDPRTFKFAAECQGHARPGQARREPEIGDLRARQFRGSPTKPRSSTSSTQALGQAHHAEGKARGENVVDLMDALRKSVGGAAGGDHGSEEGRQEAAQGIGRAQGNADAGRQKKAGEADSGEEAGGQTAAQIGVTPDPRFRRQVPVLPFPGPESGETTRVARDGLGARNPR
jgi:hypothetical protein